jgi:hypothetical protein
MSRSVLRRVKQALTVSSATVSNTKVPKILYCHVPKCAGGAVADALSDSVYAGQAIRKFGINLEATRRTAKLLSMDTMRAREVLLSYNLSMKHNYFGSGHFYCRPNMVSEYMGEWNFVTLLRNPVDRWISEFVYNTYKTSERARNTMPLEEYVESNKGKNNAETFLRYFSSMPADYEGDKKMYIDEAVENLSRFSVVGTIERLDHWRGLCESFFGTKMNIPVKNESPNQNAANNIRSNQQVMSKIEQLCGEDMQIYHRAVDLG